MSKFTGLLFLGALFTWQQASACSCMEWQNAAAMVGRSQGAYLAIPASDSQVVSADPEEFGSTSMLTKFSVIRDYKNNSAKEVTIGSWKGDGANCGTHFTKDEGPFIIFAYKNNAGMLSMSSCSVGGIDAPESIAFLKELNKL
ncbi:MAG TPA: hypothetical protein VNJ01_07070 [Bacteriovoracaceae bacterium]|nr:hypothetical protein [Bacteriovoracaceae bacterium]